MNQTKADDKPGQARGRLKIGDDWNAITIIALSQSSPLKAIAELVENSIDAKARTVTITRGREQGRPFLAIHDDGEGVPRDKAGRPDFRYVATHICDSVKRRLKADGTSALQGEFGDRLIELLDGGPGAQHNIDRRRPARLPDGHAQRRSGLCGQAHARSVRRRRHGSTDRAATRWHPRSLGRKDPVVSRGGAARPYPADRRAYQRCRPARA